MRIFRRSGLRLRSWKTGFPVLAWWIKKNRQVSLNKCTPLNIYMHIKIGEIKPFLQSSHALKLELNIPKKIVWPQSKPRLLSSIPYPPSQPEMACRVWNLDQGRELGRVRKEAVGKQGNTFLISCWLWLHGPCLLYDDVPPRQVPHQRWSMEGTWKLKSDPSSATNSVIWDGTRVSSGFP